MEKPVAPSAEQLQLLRSGARLLALRKLGDRDAAEDVAQETIARTLDALANGRVDNPDRLAAFVRGIARHIIADLAGAGRRERSLDELPGSAEPADSTRDALQALTDDEERAHLAAALRSLSRADRELLHLAFGEGLTPTEIAARLNEPSERIRKRKSRALERLREAVQRVAQRRSRSRDATDSPSGGVMTAHQEGAITP